MRKLEHLAQFKSDATEIGWKLIPYARWTKSGSWIANKAVRSVKTILFFGIILNLRNFYWGFTRAPSRENRGSKLECRKNYQKEQEIWENREKSDIGCPT